MHADRSASPSLTQVVVIIVNNLCTFEHNIFFCPDLILHILKKRTPYHNMVTVNQQLLYSNINIVDIAIQFNILLFL